MLDIPSVRSLPAQHVAVVPLALAPDEVPAAMPEAIGELLRALAVQGVAPAGPLFSYHAEPPGAWWCFEVGIAVREPVASMGRVRPGALRATRAACATYRGSYEGLGAAWGEFTAWIEASGLVPAPDLWERYLRGPESGADARHWCTEFVRPLAD